MRRRAHHLALILLLGIAAGACSSGNGDTGTAPPPPPPPPPSSPSAVASVSISGNSGALVPLQTLQLAAATRDASGNLLTGRTITWHSSNLAVASVSATGLVTAVGVGTTTVSAVSEGITGSVTVVVQSVPVANVDVTAASTTLNIGDAPQLTVTARDAQGNALTGRVVTWLSTAPAIATVSASGVVTAVSAGTTTIRATSEGVSGSVVLTVLPVSTVLEQHALLQQGFSIALASTLLQGQFEVLVIAVNVTDPAWRNCQRAEDASSYQLISGGATAPFDITLFYDAACTKPYMMEHVTVFTQDLVAGNRHLVATATYKSPTGSTLGTTTFDETNYAIPDGTDGGVVSALGLFTPANGTPAAHLGLNCIIPATGFTLTCESAVAQNFAAINRALGSVTPLSLTLAQTPDANGLRSLTFDGGATLVNGPLNSLTLSAAGPTTLAIGGGSSFATTAATGKAAAYSLFPPTPTSWTVSDAANDLRFTISVVSNTARNSVASITRISTGATLATAAVDQSGTGTITYSDGTSSSVTAWVIAQ